MEIKGVAPVSFNLYVLSVWSEGLEGASHLKRDLGLVGPDEYLDLVLTETQYAHVLGLNVLEINENEIGLQTASLGCTADAEF